MESLNSKRMARKINSTPAGDEEKPLKGVSVFIEARCEDGSDASEVLGKKLKSLGARVAPRRFQPASLTHLIWSNGDPQRIVAAKQNNVAVVTPLWVNKCIDTNSIVSEKDFEVGTPTYSEKKKLTAADRRRRKQASWESRGPQNISNLHNTDSPFFSSSQRQNFNELDAQPRKKQRCVEQNKNKNKRQNSKSKGRRKSEGAIAKNDNLKMGRVKKKRKSEGENPSKSFVSFEFEDEKDEESLSSTIISSPITPSSGRQSTDTAKWSEKTYGSANRRDTLLLSPKTTPLKSPSSDIVSTVESKGNDTTVIEGEDVFENDLIDGDTKSLILSPWQCISCKHVNTRTALVCEDCSQVNKGESNALQGQTKEERKKSFKDHDTRKKNVASSEKTTQSPKIAEPKAGKTNTNKLQQQKTFSKGKQKTKAQTSPKPPPRELAPSKSDSNRGRSNSGKTQKRKKLENTERGKENVAPNMKRVKKKISKVDSGKTSKVSKDAKKAQKNKGKPNSKQRDLTKHKNFQFSLSGMHAEVRATISDLVTALSKMSKDKAKVRILESDANPWSECSHVITPDEGEKRTLRVIFALCRGIPVVNMSWVFASLEEGMWLEHEKYLSPRYKRLEMHCRAQLLKGSRVFLGPTNDPPKTVLEKVVEAAGGKISSSLRGAELCLVVPDEGHTWFTTEVGKGGVIAAELLRMGQEGKILTQKWLFDSIEQGCQIENPLAYAIGVDIDTNMDNIGSSPGW